MSKAINVRFTRQELDFTIAALQEAERTLEEWAKMEKRKNDPNAAFSRALWQRLQVAVSQ